LNCKGVFVFAAYAQFALTPKWMADTGTLKAVSTAQAGFTETAFGKLTLKTIPGQCNLLVCCFQQKMAHRAICGFSLDKLHIFLLFLT
jgi:hypothetical protein